VALEALGGVAGRADGDIRLLPLQHALRFAKRRTALPFLHYSRIAGVGERAGAEVSANEHTVLVAPGHLALGLRQRETILHERLGLGVEFANDRGIRAAARERHERPVIARFQPRRAVPDPVLLLGLRECVEIEYRLPFRLGLAVFVERGAPPEAALVLLVAP